MNWDPFQRTVLAELGLLAYRARTTSASPGSAQPLGDAVEPVAAMDSPMLVRVARAAGLTPEALRAMVPALAAACAGLAGDAAAKRALWPQLRRLRRERG